MHLFWSSYPLLFIHLQDVREFDKLFKNLFWSSYPFLFTRLQFVREVGQLFEHFSSNHPIPSSSSVFREYVNLINGLNTSHLINFSLHLHLSPESTWPWSIVWISLFWSSCLLLFIRLKRVRQFKLFEYLSSNLLIRFQNVRELGQLFENLSSNHSIPSFLSVFSLYVNLVYCLNISYLIIPSLPLHPSPGCMWC